MSSSMETNACMVSLREKGVDLNTWKNKPSIESPIVSLREKGVDLNLQHVHKVEVLSRLPS